MKLKLQQQDNWAFALWFCIWCSEINKHTIMTTSTMFYIIFYVVLRFVSANLAFFYILRTFNLKEIHFFYLLLSFTVKTLSSENQVFNLVSMSIWCFFT